MPIEFTCPHCQKTSSVADQYAGQTGPCQACGQTITIPLGKEFGGPQLSAPPAHKSGGGGGGIAIVAAVLGVCFVLAIPCIGIMVALLLPAVQQARTAARRVSSNNNLKQIALALHNYQDTYKTLPPAYIPNEDGSPRTSWRTLILPFMEQQALADQYDFHYGWDSAENSFVQDLEIPTFHSPSSTEPTFNTSYFLVTGPDTMFRDAEAPKFADVRDGLSNTIMVVEVEGMNCHWAEPRDITYDELMQLIQTGRVSGTPGGFNVALADASVTFIPLEVNPQTLKAMTTSDGAEPISFP